MDFEVEVDGTRRRVRVHRDGGCFVVEIDERRTTVDVVRVGGATLSLLIEDESGSTASHEATIAPGTAGRAVVSVGAQPVEVAMGTRRRPGGGSPTGDGPQRIVAPMPGKIVRVLVTPGTTVSARQSMVVIEAMKMENELRSTRDGVVTEVLVREGQLVEAGMLLAVVTAVAGDG